MYKSSKKILQVNATCNWGSTGQICEGIAETADNDGWDCYIAHGSRYVNITKFQAYEVGDRNSNYKHIAYSMIFGRHGLASSKETRELVEYIKNLNPDVIHLHNIHGYYLNYKILFDYLNSVQIPVVWTLHDCWSFTGHCTHFDHIGCEKWKSECSSCPLTHTDYKSLFFDRSKANFLEKKKCFTSKSNMVIVTVSDWLRQKASESFLKIHPIKTIYNGIDTNVFKYQPSDIKESLVGDKKMLLAVATDWDKNKGLYDYIELSKILPHDYQIVMVGVSGKIRKLLPHNIVTLERTHNVTALVELYSAAEIVMNLSYLETFGLTTVEGMACGTPSIVYNKTASPELVTPETGRVVEAGHIEDVLSAISEISAIGKESFSNACRQRVLDVFEKESCHMQYIELYKELLARQ